jgi:spermidine synthase
MGTYIQSDGLTQSGGIVETIWKQTLKKVKTKNENVKSVLILGLGGGTVAKLIRKNWPDAKITGVDVDPMMVELGKKYLDLDDQNVEIIIADALYFLTHHSSLKSYDLIIVDLYNGDKFPDKFTKNNYIHLVRHGLTRGGLAVFNRLYFKDRKEEAIAFGEKLKKVFGTVEYFYPISNVMFICRN